MTEWTPHNVNRWSKVIKVRSLDGFGRGAGCVLSVVSYTTLDSFHVNHFVYIVSQFSLFIMIVNHVKRLCALVQVVVGYLLFLLTTATIATKSAFQGCQIVSARLVVGGAPHPKYLHPPFCMENKKPK